MKAAVIGQERNEAALLIETLLPFAGFYRFKQEFKKKQAASCNLFYIYCLGSPHCLTGL
ncbi:hypothetical protein DB29_02101 [Shouchella clausii]|nr:hypothetical protein DB29_02101 [Shouchella clausii]